jgi:hypothetical protein
VIEPFLVNFMALDKKLSMIYRIRFGSEFMKRGHFSSYFRISSTLRLFYLVYTLTICRQLESSSSKSNLMKHSLNLRLSICTKSRISLIRFKRRLLEFSAGSM